MLFPTGLRSFSCCQLQRWASAILVRTSAIPQYFGQSKLLQNCGLKKVAELQSRTSRFDFRNSATLCSLRQVKLLSCPFSSAQDVFKNQPKMFLELSVSMKTKKVPWRGTSTIFLASDFFSWSDPYGLLIHNLILGYHTPLNKFQRPKISS